MSQDSVQIIRGIYEALSEGDVATVLAHMEDTIEWREAENFIYADRNPYIGPQAVLDGVFTRIGSDWSTFTIAPEEWLNAGTHVIVLGKYSGTHKGTGRTVRAQFAHVWAVRNGRVMRFQQYTDTKQFSDVVA